MSEKATKAEKEKAEKAKAKRQRIAQEKREKKAAERAEKKRATVRDKHLQKSINDIKRNVYAIRNSHKTLKGVIEDMQAIASEDKRVAIIFQRWLSLKEIEQPHTGANAAARADFIFKIKKQLPFVRKMNEVLTFFKVRKVDEASDETLTAYRFEAVDASVNVDPLQQIIMLMLADLTNSEAAARNIAIAKCLDIDNLDKIVYYNKVTKQVYTK